MIKFTFLGPMIALGMVAVLVIACGAVSTPPDFDCGPATHKLIMYLSRKNSTEDPRFVEILEITEYETVSRTPERLDCAGTARYTTSRKALITYYISTSETLVFPSAAAGEITYGYKAKY